MLLKLTIFSWLMVSCVWSQEGQGMAKGSDLKADIIISERYQAGEFLIYDCQDRQWICVEQSYYQECERMRAEEILNRKADLRCAPIGEFATKRSCFQRQLFMVGQNFSTHFCQPDKINQQNIRFN